MKVKINYKRFLISVLIIFFVIFILVKCIKTAFNAESIQDNLDNDSRIDIVQEDNSSGNNEIGYKIKYNDDKISKIKSAFEDSELFSNDKMYLNSNSVIELCNLGHFKDLSCLGIIDKNEDTYQEIVVVLSPHSEDYDELVRYMIIRYQDLKETYQDKYVDELNNVDNLSIRQESGVVSLIVSSKMADVLNVLRKIR